MVQIIYYGESLMKYAFILLFCCMTMGYADVLEDLSEQTPEIADGQTTDLYDKPYNLNPVPINPRTPEPANWKDAYGRLCESIQEINTRLDLLQNRVRTLEDQTDVTENEN